MVRSAQAGPSGPAELLGNSFELASQGVATAGEATDVVAPARSRVHAGQAGTSGREPTSLLLLEHLRSLGTSGRDRGAVHRSETLTGRSAPAVTLGDGPYGLPRRSSLPDLVVHPGGGGGGGDGGGCEGPIICPLEAPVS
jgi:hypothetical protein